MNRSSIKDSTPTHLCGGGFVEPSAEANAAKIKRCQGRRKKKHAVRICRREYRRSDKDYDKRHPPLADECFYFYDAKSVEEDHD